MVRERRSVREYLPERVERGKILRCLEAARLAPSACNSQPWTFVVVDDPELKNAIADATKDPLLPLNRFACQAPVHVVIVVEKGKLPSRLGAAVKKREFPWLDIGIAAEHFCLQAVAEGLGTCMIGWFREKKIRFLLGIPENSRIGLVITLGYPADGGFRAKERKAAAEIIRWNGYDGNQGR